MIPRLASPFCATSSTCADTAEHTTATATALSITRTIQSLQGSMQTSPQHNHRAAPRATSHPSSRRLCPFVPRSPSYTGTRTPEVSAFMPVITRRTFLASAALSAAATQLPAQQKGSPQITLHIPAEANGPQIPQDFIGLSY